MDLTEHQYKYIKKKSEQYIRTRIELLEISGGEFSQHFIPFSMTARAMDGDNVADLLADEQLLTEMIDALSAEVKQFKVVSTLNARKKVVQLGDQYLYIRRSDISKDDSWAEAEFEEEEQQWPGHFVLIQAHAF